MPVYEFQCAQCNQIFEYQQRLADEPKTVCEACGGALQKLISRSAFQFKGGGWYKDLYASPKPGADAGGGGSPGTSTASTPAATSAPAGASGEGGASAATPAAPSGGGSTGSNGTQASLR